MAITTAITAYRGEDTQLVFTDQDGTDMTGWTITFTLARAKNISTKLLEKNCDFVDASSGVFQVVVESTDTEDLQPGKYYWDVWRTDENEERILGIGSYTILPDVRLP